MLLRMRNDDNIIATPTFLHHMHRDKMSALQAELEQELFSACEAGDVDRVRRVIAAGVDPKKAIREDTDETPQHIACR